MTQLTTPILPSPRDTELSRMLSAKLEAKGNANVSVQDLPDSVLVLVRQILTEMAQGHAVSLSALPKELSTQQAATVLGVSRPFVIKLMDEGQLAYRKVGSHRRVMLDEVMVYMEGARVKRLAGLAELTAEAQEFGLGY
jgi:excisionase family DNA binding protein